MIKTVKDYLQVTTESKPFWGSATVPEAVVTDDFQKDLTDFIRTNYWSRMFKLLVRCEAENGGDISASEEIRKECDMVYRTHAYEYQKIYDTTIAVYNPIENYDMKEHEEIVNSGTDTTTKDNAQQVNTDNLGQAVVTNTKGKDHTHQTTHEDTAPFESQTYKKVNQSDSDSTTDIRTDTATAEAVENTHTLGAHTDTDSLEHGHEITRDLTRHGNIGVTTSQQMLESERNLARLNLVRIVANDIIQTLCVNVEGRKLLW